MLTKSKKNPKRNAKARSSVARGSASVLRRAKTPSQLDKFLLNNRSVNSTFTYYLAGYADGVRAARKDARIAEKARDKRNEDGVWE